MLKGKITLNCPIVALAFPFCAPFMAKARSKGHYTIRSLLNEVLLACEAVCKSQVWLQYPNLMCIFAQNCCLKGNFDNLEKCQSFKKWVIFLHALEEQE